MIQRAVILLDGFESSGLKNPWQTVAGLPWLLRWMLTASRAGVKEFIVAGGENLETLRKQAEPDLKAAGIHVSWIHREGVKSITDTRCIVSAWNVFISKSAWKTLQDVEEPFQLSDGQGVFAGVQPGNDLFRREGMNLNIPGVCRVQTEGDLKAVEQKLYQALIKETEGFMSRHVERKISFAITKLLVKTPVTPNIVTAFNILLGLGAGYLLSIPSRRVQFEGALFFLFTSILDGCDGEIARLKFLESKWGGWIDFLGDNLVHVAVFSGIAVGAFSSGYGPAALTLGALAVGGTLASSLFVFFNSLGLQSNPLGSPFFSSVAIPAASSSLAKIDDFLTRRDFIYLVVALAAFGKLSWFLWMSAIGSPLFFMTLLVIRFKEPSLGEKTA